MIISNCLTRYIRKPCNWFKSIISFDQFLIAIVNQNASSCMNTLLKIGNFFSTIVHHVF